VNSLQRPSPIRRMQRDLQELGLQIEKEKFSQQQYHELCTLIYSKFQTVTFSRKPVRSHPCRHRHSLEARKEIARQIKEMHENDLIKPSMSARSSPVILVKKIHTKELRFTIDYQRLNSLTTPLFYPLPTMDEIRD